MQDFVGLNDILDFQGIFEDFYRLLGEILWDFLDFRRLLTCSLRILRFRENFEILKSLRAIWDF